MSIHIAVRKQTSSKWEDSDIWTACGVQLNSQNRYMHHVNTVDAFLREIREDQQCKRCKKLIPGGLKVGVELGIL